MSEGTIAERLARIAESVGAVPKTRNSDATGGDTYKFRGIDDVMSAVHPHFAAEGVIILADDVEVAWKDVERGKFKTVWRHYLLTIRWTFLASDGSSLSVTNTGEGLDSGDKGLGKARSYALKDLLTRMLTLPTNEPDNEAVHVPDATRDVPDATRDDIDAEARLMGFASEQDRHDRHDRANALGREVHPDNRSELRDMKELYGWPMPADKLETFEQIAQRLKGSPVQMAGEDAETEAPDDLGATGVASPAGEPELSPAIPPDAGDDAAADSPAEGAAAKAQRLAEKAAKK